MLQDGNEDVTDQVKRERENFLKIYKKEEDHETLKNSVDGEESINSEIKFKNNQIDEEEDNFTLKTSTDDGKKPLI